MATSLAPRAKRQGSAENNSGMKHCKSVFYVGGFFVGLFCCCWQFFLQEDRYRKNKLHIGTSLALGGTEEKLGILEPKKP